MVATTQTNLKNGWQLHSYDTASSTSDILFASAELTEGFAALARQQTAGRGRGDAHDEKEEEDILSSALKRFELCTKDATRDLQPVSEELEKRLNKIMSKKKKNSSSSYLKLHRALARSGVQMGVWDVSSRSDGVKWTNDAATDNIKNVLQESTNNK